MWRQDFRQFHTRGGLFGICSLSVHQGTASRRGRIRHCFWVSSESPRCDRQTLSQEPRFIISLPPGMWLSGDIQLAPCLTERWDPKTLGILSYRVSLDLSFGREFWRGAVRRRQVTLHHLAHTLHWVKKDVWAGQREQDGWAEAHLWSLGASGITISVLMRRPLGPWP